ncbi:hypothetical protein RFI_15284 [Reticulomyxa filosa]|uniref:MHD domain-containing protein n=1 Tax=Reticulomyxa filosa TaxID=46433 RepID=X6N6N4_RETFI|nr:hypothetical protein RFI_15284 [Reticulomyxa filosa]|eukprot:ETO21920.1 hypothetical protein RFI_15284 [Reticulomyxa filosa]
MFLSIVMNSLNLYFKKKKKKKPLFFNQGAQDPDVGIYQHVRSANEIENVKELTGGVGGAEKTLSSDEVLISKMLEPYSKNRGPGFSQVSMSRKGTLSASNSRPAHGDSEPSVSNKSWGDDPSSMNAMPLDDLFPSFESDETAANSSKTKAEQALKKPGNSNNNSNSNIVNNNNNNNNNNARSTPATSGTTTPVAAASASTPKIQPVRQNGASHSMSKPLEPTIIEEVTGGASSGDTASEGGGELQEGEDEANNGAWKRMEFIDASQAKVATEEDLAKVSLDMAPAPGVASKKKKGKKPSVQKKPGVEITTNANARTTPALSPIMDAANGNESGAMSELALDESPNVPLEEKSATVNVLSTSTAVAEHGASMSSMNAIAALEPGKVAQEIVKPASKPRDLPVAFTMTAKVLDRIDCTLENGKLTKFHSAGALVVTADPVPTEETVFDVKIIHLEQAATKTFSPTCAKSESGDYVRVKYPANERDVTLLNYSLNVDNPLSICPVMMKVSKRIEGSHALLHCKLRLNPKFSAVHLNEFCVKIKCQPDQSVVEKCTEQPFIENDPRCQFHWSKEFPNTLMWKIDGFAGTSLRNAFFFLNIFTTFLFMFSNYYYFLLLLLSLYKLEELELKADIDSSKPLTDFDVRCTFCIEDFGVSKISLAEPEHKQQVILQGFNYVRQVQSGDFVIR